MTAASGDRARARQGEAALTSAFRRRWTWRTRTRVTVLGAVGALVLRLLYATLRVRVSDPANVVPRHHRGERFVFAAWHDTLLLMPVALRSVPGPFRPRVLLSWHRDAELGAQAARWFGIRAIRGSSTRGAIGAMRGLLAAHHAGDDLFLVPDGPRGPRHVAKPGLAQLGRATRAAVVPVAVAASPCRRLDTWDRLLIPLPFARVAVRIGPPVAIDDATGGEMVQTAMDATVAAAAAVLTGAST